MVDMMSKDQLIQVLKEEQDRLGLNQAAFARRLRVSRQYLSDIYLNKRAPGPTILKYLGIEKTVNFEVKK
jgi:transcriptional regulator with XRE-family HTH domain